MAMCSPRTTYRSIQKRASGGPQLVATYLPMNRMGADMLIYSHDGILYHSGMDETQLHATTWRNLTNEQRKLNVKGTMYVGAHLPKV